MKKSIAALLLVVLLMSAAGFYLFQQQQNLTNSPFTRELPFNSLSKAITGVKGNLYVIDNSKKTINKIDPVGTILYSIASGTSESGELDRFNDMAVDEQGYLFTVSTLLDPYGITVKSEQLVRYTPDGKLDRSLFSQVYNDPQNRHYRVGSIKNPQIRGGDLYFYNDEGPKITLYKVASGSDEARPVLSIDLPENKNLADVDGYLPGSIYYSTRSGEIYRAGINGKSEMVYPLPGIDRTRRNFPESLHLDKEGRLVFIDYNSKSISRLDPNNPYTIEELVTQETAMKNGIELAFETTTTSMGPDDSIVIVEEAQLTRRMPDGSLTPPLTKAHYSSAYISHLFVYWTVAAAGLLLFFLAIFLLYYKILKRRLSLVVKQILIFIPVIAVSMILLSTTIYTNLSKKMDAETISELVLLAKNGQNFIDGDLLEQMSSPLDYKGPAYQLFRQKIRSVYDNNTRVENQGFYKAVYKYENGVIYRILEDDDEMHMFNPFPSTPKNQEVVLEGKIATDQWQDETGYWMYALAPIYNSSGKIVGIFEMDKNLEGIIAHRRGLLQSIITIIALISVGLLLILMLMSFFMLSSIRKLRNSVGEIAKGNWDTVVTINTRDEVSDLGDSFNKMAAHIRDYIIKVESVSQSYYRFVPQQFLRFLNKNTILDTQLGNQVEQNMAVLICNIRSFYKLSKRMTPEENFNFVNSFLKRFGPYVRNHEGMVNKYLGAGFMALFPNQADESLIACIEMRKELELYNVHRVNSGYRPIELGIGLHKGPLRLGIIGEEKRLEGNVISDGVNLAVMLEKMTEPLGASVLITEYVIQSLDDASAFQYRNLGFIQVDGVEEPLHLYDVYQGDPETIRVLKEKTKALFEEAVMLYQVGRFYDAREAFLMVIKQNRQDKAAQLYFYICDEYFQNGTTKDWKGTLSVS
jgi:adenylate cyclase